MKYFTLNDKRKYYSSKVDSRDFKKVSHHVKKRGGKRFIDSKKDILENKKTLYC